mmetsp:Transcript_5568/g.10756  ORF Transcript_5568/g.10756 Transcript_5568/m.10756 type:complete len:564 (+) Transcript_5568:464-2155(+)|eukprot:CAMPEP_0201602584 /NCGR_PEP_ID=MMETSP0492-20130828/3264_1 /ASSEMBLY_ACC=CAM_ASM_000837 /TAXON_ID=420259 /ORGANISM="Thalassiosira gravida, Strain GMp14c1" /LENGTH=563 /DNA_ID=CAMNT_0048066131 /DNA_START=428 /DNA_END=2119 /DNA_ORIENTATION=+
MESTPQEEAEGQAIVQVLAVVLERLVSANSHLAASQQEETKFHALRAPAIGILQYLERIHKYASCSKECFILALIYIDRLIQQNNFLLTDLNVHRVVITAVLLAAKFFDDAYYNNAYYAKVGGVLVSEMNTLECEFLFKIDFSLRVVPEVFDKYRDELISHSNVMGLNRIENYSDEELLRRVCTRQQAQSQQQQVQAMAACQHQLNSVTQAVAPQAPAPQAPVLRTYSQTECDPATALYPDLTPAVAACHQDQSAAAAYPMQALHQSMMELTQQANQLPQPQQQQHTATTLDPVFPFPTLTQQVSVQQQAQAPPSQNPTDLDLVYHTVTNTATPASTVATAPQDVSLSQYMSQALQQHQGVMTAPQQQPAQVYAQAELMDSLYRNTLATTPAAAPMAQAPEYSQHANYYANGAGATTAAQATTVRPSMLQSHHPEITPSPPPQPPVHIHHGAHQQLPMGCGNSSQHMNDLAEAYLKSRPDAHAAAAQHAHNHLQQQLQHHRYATPADAALDLHRAQQQQQQLLPSRPIAITMGNQHHHLSENSGGWPYNNMLSLERVQGRSPA